MFSLTLRNFCFFFSLYWSVSAFADLEIWDQPDYVIGAGLNGSLGASWSYKAPRGVSQSEQGQPNQPLSADVAQPNNIFVSSYVRSSAYGEFNFRLGYVWDLPVMVGLYQAEEKKNRVFLKDFYYVLPQKILNLNYWVGIRTFEFYPVTLLSMPNPFDQLHLQGIGISNDTLQFALSINRAPVKTIATTTLNGNTQIVTNSDGAPVFYDENEFIISCFLHGKFLLSEGRLFEPIAAFRYYTGQKSPFSQQGIEKQHISSSSSFIAGGIFSRPITNGIAGATTVWFATLPSNETVPTQPSQLKDEFPGYGRVSSDETPLDMIGLTDASEFHLEKNFGLLTALYILNNTYSNSKNVLKPSSDKMGLIPNGTETSDSRFQVSAAVEPAYFLTDDFLLGFGSSGQWQSKKLFSDDSNFLIFSPLIRWVFDEKLNSEKYISLSINYGIYDWKSKVISGENRTNKFMTVRLASCFSF